MTVLRPGPKNGDENNGKSESLGHAVEEPPPSPVVPLL